MYIYIYIYIYKITKTNKQNMIEKLSSKKLFIDKVKVNIRSMYLDDQSNKANKQKLSNCSVTTAR